MHQEPNKTIPRIQITAETFLQESSAGAKKYDVIEVTDNGIGFDQMHAEHIFQVFHRLHGKSEYDGTGPGLTIARKIVENHNGRIVAESKYSFGASFKVYLPS